MFEDFHLKNNDKKYLLTVLIFSVALVGYYIYFNVNLGIYCSDVYVYLLNALHFTGVPIKYPYNIYLSPVICFLTSILFRLGLVDKIAIFIVTGIFAILGNIGLYILLRRYFDELMSLSGVIVYSTFSLTLTWLANGTLDVPAVAVTIWIALFGIIAIKENSKYYRYLLVLMVIGFYTRYTTMLILPALLLFYVFENGFKIRESDLKDIRHGLIVAILLFVIITVVVIVLGNGAFAFGGQFEGIILNEESSTLDPGFNDNRYYYLENFASFISDSHSIFEKNPELENPTALSYIILAILAIASVLWLKDVDKSNYKNFIVPAVLFIISALTFKSISSMITIVLTLVGLYLLGKDSDNKVGYFMLGWLLANLIFYSEYDIKVNRYIIPLFPPLTYFILRSVSIINEKIKINKNIIPLILIVLFAVQGFAFTMTIDVMHDYNTEEQVSNYIIDNNPDYEKIEIGVYNIRPYEWYLGYNTMGIKKTNTTAIEESNVTYYISDTKLNDLTNYTQIKTIGEHYIYQKS